MKILRALKAWPWYYWLIAAVVPGGLLFVGLHSRARPGVPTIDPDNAKAGEKNRIDQLIGSVVDKANALRAGLAGDPLAANLLGVSPDLIKLGDAGKVAQTTAEADRIKAEISSHYDIIANTDSAWSTNHFGGVSYDQYQGYVGKEMGLINALQAKLAALLS